MVQKSSRVGQVASQHARDVSGARQTAVALMASWACGEARSKRCCFRNLVLGLNMAFSGMKSIRSPALIDLVVRRPRPRPGSCEGATPLIWTPRAWDQCVKMRCLSSTSADVLVFVAGTAGLSSFVRLGARDGIRCVVSLGVARHSYPETSYGELEHY